MRLIKYFILPLLLCSSVIYAEEAIQPLDTIVATVNDSVITQNDLDNAVAAAENGLQTPGSATPDDATLKKQVLNQLIDRQLQLQLAHDAGVKISQAEIDEGVQRIADQNHITPDALYQTMAAHGMSKTQYRHEIETELLVQKLEQQEVVPKIAISPDEVDAFIKKSALDHPPLYSYQVEDYFIPLSDNPSTTELNTAKEKAEKAMQTLRQGRTPAVQKNDLGWLGADGLPSAFTETVTHMQKNAVAKPIQTGNGFHVLRLTGKKLVQDQTLSKQDAQRQLFEQKFDKTLKQWLSLLRSRATIHLHPGS